MDKIIRKLKSIASPVLTQYTDTIIYNQYINNHLRKINGRQEYVYDILDTCAAGLLRYSSDNDRLQHMVAV